MLKDAKAYCSFSVKDLDEARSFYVDKLGLTAAEGPGPLRLSVSDTSFMIYPKPNHVPAEYTVMNFKVGDLDAKVDELIASGISFEKYDNEQMKTDEKGILRGDHGNIAWMKDPAGNILSVMGEM